MVSEVVQTSPMKGHWKFQGGRVGVLTFSLPESVMETFKVLLPFEDLWMKSYGMTIHMKPLKQ